MKKMRDKEEAPPQGRLKTEREKGKMPRRYNAPVLVPGSGKKGLEIG
jgi:hypothetical protein